MIFTTSHDRFEFDSHQDPLIFQSTTDCHKKKKRHNNGGVVEPQQQKQLETAFLKVWFVNTRQQKQQHNLTHLLPLFSHLQNFIGEANLEQVGQLRRLQLALQKVHLAILDLHQAVGDLQLQVFDIQIRGVVFEHFVTAMRLINILLLL